LAWVYADDINLAYNPGIVEYTQEERTGHNIIVSPNPCTKATYFTFQLPDGMEYRITLFDVLGRHVRTLEGLSYGSQESVMWNRHDDKDIAVDAGIYLYRFESDAFNTTGKVVVR
jgi:hypothetical protein